MQPSQIAASVPRTNRVVAMGLLKGFCQGFIFSINGTAIKPSGRAAISPMPNNLLGTTRSISKVGKRNHSGSISNGVTNGFAASPIGVGSKIDNPIMQLNVPRITTGNV